MELLEMNNRYSDKYISEYILNIKFDYETNRKLVYVDILIPISRLIYG